MVALRSAEWIPVRSRDVVVVVGVLAVDAAEVGGLGVKRGVVCLFWKRVAGPGVGGVPVAADAVWVLRMLSSSMAGIAPQDSDSAMSCRLCLCRMFMTLSTVGVACTGL